MKIRRTFETVLLLFAVAAVAVSCDSLANLTGGPKSSNNYLLSLNVSEGTLAPSFDKNVLSYTIENLGGATSLSISADTEQASASLSGTGTKALQPGSNKFDITVTSEAGKKRVYSLTATGPADNATLSALTVDGTSVPGFQADTLEYSIDVTNETTSVVLAATATQNGAIVTGLGTKSSLAVGDNVFDVVVTRGGATQTYKVTVKRAAPVVQNLNLASLKVAGTPVPDFDAATLSYTVTVVAGTASANLEAGAEDGGAVVAGAGTKSLVIGNNVFEITVTKGGESRTYTVTVVRPEDPIPVSELVASGVAAMKTGSYSVARTYFTQAIASDSDDNAAKLWSSLLDLASIQTDPVMVDLFANRIGVASYPDSLDEYMSNTWFNKEYYSSYSGFIPAGADWETSYQGTYVRGTFTPSQDGTNVYYYTLASLRTSPNSVGGIGYFELDDEGTYYVQASSYPFYNSGWESLPAETQRYWISSNLADLTKPVFLPELDEPVQWIQNDANGPLLTEYPLILALNILTKNPVGLNTLIDSVVSKMDFTSIDERLSSFGDGVRIEIPAELLTNLLPPDADIPVSVSRNEVKLLLAQLKLQKAFALYLQSVNLNYDLSFVQNLDPIQYDNFHPTDANDDGLVDIFENFYETAPGFKTSSFLTTRDAGNRGASKAAAVSGLTDLLSAVTGLAAQYADSESYYHTLNLFPSGPGAIDPEAGAAALLARLETSGDGLTVIKDALVNNSLISMANVTEDSPTADVLGPLFYWPVAGDAGNTVAPSALWDSNFLDLHQWLEKDGNGDYIPYLVVRSYGWSGEIRPVFTAALVPSDNSPLSAEDFGIQDFVSSVGVVLSAKADPALMISLFPSQADYFNSTPGYVGLPVNDYQFYSSHEVVQPTVPDGQLLVLDWLNR